MEKGQTHSDGQQTEATRLFPVDAGGAIVRHSICAVPAFRDTDTMKNYCVAIADLWLMLNPHCTVEGCLIDETGTVSLRLWFSRNGKSQPLEIILGNPALQVLKTLKNALNEDARSKRLSKISARTIIGERTGNSMSGEKGAGDK